MVFVNKHLASHNRGNQFSFRIPVWPTHIHNMHGYDRALCTLSVPLRSESDLIRHNILVCRLPRSIIRTN